MKKASNFKDAVKQKLYPQFGGTGNTQPNVPQVPNANMAGLSTNVGQDTGVLRLGIRDILAPGGTQGVADIASEYWFSALQPIQPIAPPSYRPRQRAFL